MKEHFSRTAIVTGGSKGIGAAIAQRLAADGFSVVISYAHSAADADAVVGVIRAGGGEALASRDDAAALDCARTLFDVAEREFGPVDVFVNNAGILRQASIMDSTDEMFAEVVAINLGGYFRGMRECARRLRDGGRIINISTSVVGYYHPNFGVYAATKAGVDAMTHILAKELGPRQITVNAISPGQVETKLFLEGKTDLELQLLTSRIPLGRLGQPSDIVGIASFLAGPESGWLSGQILRVNGGGV